MKFRPCMSKEFGGSSFLLTCIEHSFNLLNMCSAPHAEPPGGDLTARARIRDAAILLFGKNGFAPTSVRAIAAEAGVSPGLVIHHFGSKAALRQACDEYVLGELIDAEEDAAEADLLGTMQRWLADPQVFQPAFDYLVRTFGEDSETSDRLFDQLVRRTERMLADGLANGTMISVSDPKATALLLAIQGLALLTMSRHVGRTLGQSQISTAILQRLTVPTIELYTHGIYSDSSMLDAATAALEGDET